MLNWLKKKRNKYIAKLYSKYIVKFYDHLTINNEEFTIIPIESCYKITNSESCRPYHIVSCKKLITDVITKSISISYDDESKTVRGKVYIAIKKE